MADGSFWWVIDIPPDILAKTTCGRGIEGVEEVHVFW